MANSIYMKTAILLLSTITLSAQITDLGLISPKKAIALDVDARRPDFKEFRIDFLPYLPPTNLVSIVRTNSQLTMEDLAPLPSGRILMGVKSVCLDATESPINFYVFELRRAGPRAPVARVTFVASEKGEYNFTNSLEVMKAKRNPVVPAPAPVTQRQMYEATGNLNDPLQSVNKVIPLPNSNSTTYGEHLDNEMLKAINRKAFERNRQ